MFHAPHHVVRPSSVHGVGVIAVEPARKDDIPGRHLPVIAVMILEDRRLGGPIHIIRAIEKRAEHQYW